MDFEIIETQKAFDEKVKSILEENTKTVTDAVKKQFIGWGILDKTSFAIIKEEEKTEDKTGK